MLKRTNFCLAVALAIPLAFAHAEDTNKGSEKSRIDALEAQLAEQNIRIQKLEARGAGTGVDAMLATRVVPYFREGKLLGLRVFALKEDSPLTKLGARNGDILLELNGTPIYDAMDLMKLAHGEKPKTLRIDRAGQVFDLMDGAIHSSSSSTASMPNIGTAPQGQAVTKFSKSEFERLVGQPAEALSQMRAVPYFKEGKSIGARIFAIRNGSLFQKIGLLNGDIILSIDGAPTTGVETMAKIIAPLDKAERRISLERNLAPVTLSFGLE